MSISSITLDLGLSSGSTEPAAQTAATAIMSPTSSRGSD
ncbi:hypothetical protein SNOG_04591 [Parastagonospora nodorum SN15]|uniref:Uncharacterized protein n=1 Tax=Phaeosphaeria nodorum (strain SN15 / ATCC MYA-4574 / FGSC 10173) TaxID=321614 RepID=Q0UUH3_PHANO|nr:hypothetical protein SNOG_04591 [Parastagonospora nodorum SN15]EAT88351.1 hypothetical protein SNOG_04591 [Parastagonospora nodorum SN15]